MKIKLVLYIFFGVFVNTALSAQTLPDYLNEQKSPSHGYYENRGQIISDSGIIDTNDIIYYTERTQPQVLIGNSSTYFVTRIKNALNDSLFDIYKFEMSFGCPALSDGTGSLVACPLDLSPSEETGDFLNYYLSHCSTGITGVSGYSRIKANDIYNGINYHFYSNQVGFKSYLEVMPGGDVSNIHIMISGQDSLIQIDSFNVLLASNSYGLNLPLLLAYTVDSNSNMTLLNWKPYWIINPDSTLSIGVGTYNLSERLILVLGTNEAQFFGKTIVQGNLDWSTFYGGSGMDHVKDIQLNANDETFVLVSTKSTNFPTFNGFQTGLAGYSDAHITFFDNNHQRKWATYYGGEYFDGPEKLGLYEDYVFLVGTTNSSDLPMPSVNNGNFVQSYINGLNDAFVISLDIQFGELDWATYFGGSWNDAGLTIDIIKETDISTGKIIIGGQTMSVDISTNCSPALNKFPGCINSSYGYNQTVLTSTHPILKYDGFIAEFNRDTKDLIWSTLFGGDGTDVVVDVKSHLGAELVICGATLTNNFASTISSPTLPSTSGHFPLANPGGGAFFQSYKPSINDVDGFVAMFDDTRNLIWCTLYGGGGDDNLVSIEIANEDIYVLGSTATSTSTTSCIGQSNGNLPMCNSNSISHSQTSLSGSRDNIILRFDLSNNALLWSTYVGGNGIEGNIPNSPPNYDFYRDNITGDLAVMGQGSDQYVMISSTTTNNVPTHHDGFFYFQSDNASLSDPQLSDDGFLYCFNNTNQVYWASHFGGGCNCQSSNILPGNENIEALAANQNYFVIGGLTNTANSTTPYLCPSIPGATPYCDKTINGSNDAFVTMFDMSQIRLNVDSDLQNRSLTMNYKIYPNPTKKSVSVKALCGSTEILVFELFTIAGLKVNGMETALDEDGQNVVDLSVLSPGFYILKITDRNGIYSYKISKE